MYSCTNDKLSVERFGHVNGNKIQDVVLHKSHFRSLTSQKVIMVLTSHGCRRVI